MVLVNTAGLLCFRSGVVLLQYTAYLLPKGLEMVVHLALLLLSYILAGRPSRLCRSQSHFQETAETNESYSSLLQLQMLRTTARVRHKEKWCNLSVLPLKLAALLLHSSSYTVLISLCVSYQVEEESHKLQTHSPSDELVNISTTPSPQGACNGDTKLMEKLHLTKNLKTGQGQAMTDNSYHPIRFWHAYSEHSVPTHFPDHSCHIYQCVCTKNTA